VLTIAVVGGKKSGKTTTIELMVKELSNRGYQIVAAKHIPEPNFTIDTKGKDTWKYVQAGAKTVIAVSSDEIATVERVSTKDVKLEEIMKKCRNQDVVFLEGFRELVAKDKHICKVAVVNSPEDFAEAVDAYEPILAFTGTYSTEEACPEIPYVDVLKDPKKLADIIEKGIKKKL
jgi:molybdopterin-guanine dinucleotide biosynthesis protein B